jgi:antimicrobial peptide system SdpA family protein
VTRTSLIGIWVVVVTVIFGVPALYSIHAALPPNVVSLPLEELIDARRWAPQGWGFFTRSPREPQVLPFARDPAETWRFAGLPPHVQVAWAFGLNRRSRAQGVEIGLLLGTLPQKVWKSCDAEPVVCVTHAVDAVKITNESPSPTLCGRVALVRQEPLPWAWAADGADEVMPSEIVLLDVSCSKR